MATSKSLICYVHVRGFDGMELEPHSSKFNFFTMDQKNFVTKTALQSALEQTEQSHWIPIDQKNVTALLALCLNFRVNITTMVHFVVIHPVG